MKIEGYYLESDERGNDLVLYCDGRTFKQCAINATIVTADRDGAEIFVDWAFDPRRISKRLQKRITHIILTKLESLK